MKNFRPLFLLIAVAALVGCNQEYSPRNPLAMAATPTPVPAGFFEDFNSGPPLSPNIYTGSGTLTSTWDNTVFFTPSHSWHLLANCGGWGGAINIESNYAVAGVVNCSGKTSLTFAIMSDTAITGYSAQFIQVTGGANFMSPPQNITATNTWAQVSIPISSFTPNGGTGPMNLATVQRFEIQVPDLTNANIWVDDIAFK